MTIRNGDHVIVRRTPGISPSDIPVPYIAIVVEDEYYGDDLADGIYVLPFNRDYQQPCQWLVGKKEVKLIKSEDELLRLLLLDAAGILTWEDVP